MAESARLRRDMPLPVGTRLGPYEIAAAIGAGGMGEVFRARDTRLNRDVALKILPDAFAHDADRMARFTREAQTLAALNHPHIAHIHGIEESDGVRALVMELVEGDDLAQLIARGPLPIDEALPIARQIADALDAAHERGIVHRDLKPANIKLTPDGTVKVLDFGLAKALEPAGGIPRGPADIMNSPTMTSPARLRQGFGEAGTEIGMILGTAAYMAPEQAKGKAVDKRADIWAFGCVLFEMLTGRPLFARETVTETLAAVMRDAPPLDALPPGTPRHVEALLGRCLERDPKRRLRDIGEARFVLDTGIAESDPSRVPPRGVAADAPPGRPLWRLVAPWVVAAASLGVAGYVTTTRGSSVARDSLELEIGPPPDAQFLIDSNSGNVLLSPDGTKIVFRAATPTRGDALWVRSLTRDDARPLAGTENAQYPFWAPDSRRLAFFAASKLKTLDLAAGLPQVIADAPNGRGGSWGEDDFILFAPIGGGTIYRMSALGGKADAVTHLDTSRGENAHYWPVILPGGRKFLYFVRSYRPENNGIYVASIDGTGAVRLVSSLSSSMYAPPRDGRPGSVLWVQNGDLLAQAFDAERGALSGQPATIATGVRVIESQRGVFASVSRTGTIAWAVARAAHARFAWYDREGRRLDTVPIEEGDLQQPTISPDGRRLLFTRVANGTADIFLHDFRARTSRRVTDNPDYDEVALWSPDSAEMIQMSSDKGQNTLMRSALDGSAAPVELIRGTSQLGPRAWSPDRRYVLVQNDAPGSGTDVFVLSPDNPRNVTPLVTGPGNDGDSAAFSPDGRWIVFTSQRTGRGEVYVARFRGEQSPPSLGGRPIQISANGGGVLPGGWRRDGKEIVFGSQDGQVMAVTVDVRDESISASQPIALFRLPSSQSGVTMTPDGDRFIVSEYPNAAGQTIHVLTNWHARLNAGR